jgi:hypothetical protein
VTIYDGSFALKSCGGACIGAGGYQENYLGEDRENGYIHIYGGKIFADFFWGNAVGGGQNTPFIPELLLNVEADIIAFGRTHSNFPGINSGDDMPNIGTGHYVNLNLVIIKGIGNKMLVVYDKANPGTPVRIEKIPYDFYLISYTTGTTTQRTDHVYTGTPEGGLTQLRRVKDKSTDIYSVNRTMQYHDPDDMTPALPYPFYFRSLCVEFGDGEGFDVQFLVTEKYVDVNGIPIPGKSDTSSMVPYEGIYNKTLPIIGGYDARGHKWDYPLTAPDYLYTPGNPQGEVIRSERIVYFVYEIDPGTASVTVSKTVTGEFASRNESFKFTVFFIYADGTLPEAGETFACEGGVLPGISAAAPEGGVITLYADGEATFSLKHGQTLTITGIPADALIRVTETPNGLYKASYKDGETADIIDSNDTDFITAGAGGWRFDFINLRLVTVPTGIDFGGIAFEIVLILAALLIILSVLIVRHIAKKVR